jgi:DNA gyrase/topoisomerase IV subunit A
MVNKSRLIEQIAELARDKKIEGISDLRDESDRDGMRVVVDLKRDAIPYIVLNQLYKHTQMQSTFGVIMLALVGGVPKVLNLKEMLTTSWRTATRWWSAARSTSSTRRWSASTSSRGSRSPSTTSTR